MSKMIEIDSFTGLEQERQAYDIRQLVKREKRWLGVVRPDTLTRHRNLHKSTETLARMVLDNDISLHIIRRDKVAVGLGTIIRSLTVRHPIEEETYTGKQIDYWAQKDVSNESHREIASLLAGLHGYEGTVLGLLTASEMGRARGIPQTMQPVGSPSRLEVIAADDRFNISHIPSLQLYTVDVQATGSLG